MSRHRTAERRSIFDVSAGGHEGVAEARAKQNELGKLLVSCSLCAGAVEEGIEELGGEWSGGGSFTAIRGADFAAIYFSVALLGRVE